MSASDNQLLMLDRWARIVSEAELADLIGRAPPHPLITHGRREKQRAEGQQLCDAVTDVARGLGVTFSEWEQRLQDYCQAVLAVMNGLTGRPWCGFDLDEAIDAHQELLRRFEECRAASAAFQRFAVWHGVTDSALPPSDGNPVPPTWDELLGELNGRLAQLQAGAKQDADSTAQSGTSLAAGASAGEGAGREQDKPSEEDLSKGRRMSAERLSADALRERNRKIDAAEREKRITAEQEGERQPQFQKLLRDFGAALSLVLEEARDALRAGRSYDPAPHMPQLVFRLQAVLAVLRASGWLALLPRLDREDVCRQAYGSSSTYGPPEKIRAALEFVAQRLQETVEASDSCEALATELCDPSLYPAGPMFELLLRVLSGLNRRELKPAQDQQNEKVVVENSDATQRPLTTDSVATAGLALVTGTKNQGVAVCTETPSQDADARDKRERDEASAKARELWDRDPLRAFDTLRDQVCDAVHLVSEIYRQALNAPEESLASVARELHEPLRRAVIEARAMWHGTLISEFLDRPAGTVFLSCDGRKTAGAISGSCYHDLALGVALGVLGSFHEDTKSIEFTRFMRRKTSAGDEVAQHLSSITADVRCECQQGKVEWRARASVKPVSADSDSNTHQAASDQPNHALQNKVSEPGGGGSLSPELRGRIEEIRRAAEALRNVTYDWERWLLRVGKEIEACPDYGHTALTPPIAIIGMAQALVLEKRSKLALRTLYGHCCVPPSLRKQTLENALALFPCSPKGAIKSEKDKAFVSVVRQVMPSLRDLSSDVAHFIDHLDFAPQSVIDSPMHRPSADDTQPSSTSGGKAPNGPTQENAEPHVQSESQSAASIEKCGRTNEELVRQYTEGHPKGRIDDAIRQTGLTERKIRRTKTWKGHEEKMLDEYLQGHPSADTRDVEREFSFSPPKTVTLAAWTAHMARRESAKPPQGVKERPLTDAGLSCRPDAKATDPADVVNHRDSLFRALVEHADRSTKAALNKLNEAGQAALLDHFVSQCGAAELDAIDQARKVELALEVAKAWLEEREQDQRQAARRKGPG